MGHAWSDLMAVNMLTDLGLALTTLLVPKR